MKDLFKKITEEVVNAPIKEKKIGTINLNNKHNNKEKKGCC